MEREKSWLTSGAFAELCGTTKETLRHYKDMGLLLPAHRGDNNYSYYDVEQFYDFYAISIFRQTGTPLEEIGRCLERQSVSETAALLREQRFRAPARRSTFRPRLRLEPSAPPVPPPAKQANVPVQTRQSLESVWKPQEISTPAIWSALS